MALTLSARGVPQSGRALCPSVPLQSGTERVGEGRFPPAWDGLHFTNSHGDATSAVDEDVDDSWLSGGCAAPPVPLPHPLLENSSAQADWGIFWLVSLVVFFPASGGTSSARRDSWTLPAPGRCPSYCC